MGNSGFRKIFVKDEIVETKYRNVHQIDMLGLNKEISNLEAFKGRKMLFIPFSIKNRLTPQFINALHEQSARLKSAGVEVVGLLSNDFPGDKADFEEIYKTAKTLDVDFPLYPSVRFQ